MHGCCGHAGGPGLWPCASCLATLPSGRPRGPGHLCLSCLPGFPGRPASGACLLAHRSACWSSGRWTTPSLPPPGSSLGSHPCLAGPVLASGRGGLSCFAGERGSPWFHSSMGKMVGPRQVVGLAQTEARWGWGRARWGLTFHPKHSRVPGPVGSPGPPVPASHWVMWSRLAGPSFLCMEG